MTRIHLTLTFIALSFTAASAAAAGYEYGTGLDTSQDDANQFFADAIEDYTPTGAGNLSWCIDGVESFADWLVAAGHEDGLVYTDGDAWSADFEWYRHDDIYNDAADISYFSGHGSSGAFHFGNATYPMVRAGETRWGDQDVEFVALDACSSLDYRGRYKFATNNQDEGVHYILGFATSAWDTTVTADYFGMYLWAGYPVRSAWTYATMAGHDSSFQGAYVRFKTHSCDTVNDTLTSQACDPTSGSSFRTAVWDL